MGIKYDSDIIGKNYYINLYNEAILSNSNVMKIKNDLEKDKKYTDFYNQKLRKVNEYSLEIYNENNDNYIYDNNNNNLYLEKNCGKKGFFSDYDDTLIKKIFYTQLTYSFVEINSEYIDKAKNAIPKLLIPFEAIKKYTLINIYPEVVVKINRILDISNYLIDEKLFLISIMIFLLLIIIIFLVFRKRKKNN